VKLPTNKELGIKPTKRQKEQAERFVRNALLDTEEEIHLFGKSCYAICPECGEKTVDIREFRSNAFPRATPFLRMACADEHCDVRHAIAERHDLPEAIRDQLAHDEHAALVALEDLAAKDAAKEAGEVF
jgi:hypothetical protein